jgi:hypothetical protein
MSVARLCQRKRYAHTTCGGQARLDITPESLNELMTTTEASRATGITPGSIRTWASRGHLEPAGLDERGRPMYRLRDILRCERDRRVAALGGRALPNGAA